MTLQEYYERYYTIKCALPLKKWGFSPFHWMLKLSIPDQYQVTLRDGLRNKYTVFMDRAVYELSVLAASRPDIVAAWHIKPLNNSSNGG